MGITLYKLAKLYKCMPVLVANGAVLVFLAVSCPFFTTFLKLMDLSILIVWMCPFVVLGLSGEIFTYSVFYLEIPVSKQCSP